MANASSAYVDATVAPRLTAQLINLRRAIGAPSAPGTGRALLEQNAAARRGYRRRQYALEAPAGSAEVCLARLAHDPAPAELRAATVAAAGYRAIGCREAH